MPEIAEAPSLPKRPRAWLKKITFHDGTTLELDRSEVVIIVGPNNTGKSATLRDLDQHLTHRVGKGVIVSSIELELEGTADEVAKWADPLVKPGTSNVVLPFGALNRGTLGTRWNQAHEGLGLQELKLLFAIHLSTEERLLAANDVENIDFNSETPTRPLHHLWDDRPLEMRLSQMFDRAFGVDLVVNHGAGTRISLHLGTRPVPVDGDRMNKAYRNSVAALQKIQTQGDGIRAFVGVLLHALVFDRDMILIDEPDAFLHPPQAATLGQLLASELQLPRDEVRAGNTVEAPRKFEQRQLIVSTHSSDFLRGVLDAPNSQVRVVRLQRKLGQHTRVKELAPELVRHLWRDPILRFSNIFDGLFHDGVIICESDGDCRFYAALMNTVAIAHKPDLLLTYSGGKQRVPTIAKALKALDVPVRAVVDFDALHEAAELKAIYEALGGTWSDIERDHRIVQKAVQDKRPELSTADAKKRIQAALDPVTTDTLPKTTAAEVAAAVKRASPWAEAKRVGKSFVPNGDASTAFQMLVGQLRRHGVYLVEVGEVEQFCKVVPQHGPAWVIEALNRDLAQAPELEEARKFAKSLLSDW